MGKGGKEGRRRRKRRDEEKVGKTDTVQYYSAFELN
jgi:hypothetical protein